MPEPYDRLPNATVGAPQADRGKIRSPPEYLWPLHCAGCRSECPSHLGRKVFSPQLTDRQIGGKHMMSWSRRSGVRDARIGG